MWNMYPDVYNIVYVRTLAEVTGHLQGNAFQEDWIYAFA